MIWFVRKSRLDAAMAEAIEARAEVAALKLHCETLQAEIGILLVKLRESEAARAEASKKPARKRAVKRKSPTAADASSPAGQ